MKNTYSIVRLYANLAVPSEVLKEGLTLEDAWEHCCDPETSSQTCTHKDNVARSMQYGPWFDSYQEE